MAGLFVFVGCVQHFRKKHALSLETLFLALLYYADFFFKTTFSKNIQEYNQSVKQLDPDQVRSVGPDLGPNCLQKLSADDTWR